MYDHAGVDGGSLGMRLSQQQADGTKGLEKRLPSLSAAVAMGRSRMDVTIDNGLYVCPGVVVELVVLIDGIDSGLDLRPFDEDPSQHDDPSFPYDQLRVQIVTLAASSKGSVMSLVVAPAGDDILDRGGQLLLA